MNVATDEFEEFVDQAVEALQDTRFKKDLTSDQRRQLCENAVKLCEKYKITRIQYSSRVVVKYSDLLQRYLNIPMITILHDDITCMMSRCVEQSLTESSKILASYIQKKDDKYVLKLTPRRYKIDGEIYERSLLRRSFQALRRSAHDR